MRSAPRPCCEPTWTGGASIFTQETREARPTAYRRDSRIEVIFQGQAVAGFRRSGGGAATKSPAGGGGSAGRPNVEELAQSIGPWLLGRSCLGGRFCEENQDSSSPRTAGGVGQEGMSSAFEDDHPSCAPSLGPVCLQIRGTLRGAPAHRPPRAVGESGRPRDGRFAFTGDRERRARVPDPRSSRERTTDRSRSPWVDGETRCRPGRGRRPSGPLNEKGVGGSRAQAATRPPRLNPTTSSCSASMNGSALSTVRCRPNVDDVAGTQLWFALATVPLGTRGPTRRGRFSAMVSMRMTSRKRRRPHSRFPPRA